jgi:hypothetical protein
MVEQRTFNPLVLGSSPRRPTTSELGKVPWLGLLDRVAMDRVVDRTANPELPLSRALHRDGHIERLPSGSFRVKVYAGVDPLTGRELRFRRTVKTQSEAQIVLGELLRDNASGKRPESSVTVAELLDQYLGVAELESSTRDTYAGYIRRTILPALGASGGQSQRPRLASAAVSVLVSLVLLTPTRWACTE